MTTHLSGRCSVPTTRNPGPRSQRCCSLIPEQTTKPAADQPCTQIATEPNLYISDGTPGDQVKLDNELSYNVYGVQSVSFADGSSLTEAQLAALETAGTTGADSLYGTSGPETFDGKGAPAGLQDYEQGNGGGDTFIYNQGYGQLEINETDYSANPSNTLQFGPGITASNLTVSADASGNLHITDGIPSDQVKLDNELNYSAYGVQSVHFPDGSSLTEMQMITLADTASINNQTLYGSGAGGYGDVFLYIPGTGSATINETDYTSGRIDILQFGAGVTAAQITASTDGSGTVFIGDGVAGDSIKLTQQLNSSGVYGVNELKFSDGSSLSRAQIGSLIPHT